MISRGQRHRCQTPRYLLIYRRPFGNNERVTDSADSVIYEREYLGAFEGDESRDSRLIF